MRPSEFVRAARAAVGTASVILATSVATVNVAQGASVLPRTIVDLIDLSEYILVGTAVDVHDGLTPNQLPYTEVTLQVDESLKGEVPHTYTFRQFGLLEPRQMPDGRTNLMVSPDGWPRFRSGEKVVEDSCHSG